LKICSSSFLELGADLYEAGYTNITNIDISNVVISQMTHLHSGKEDMECMYYLD
jgi:hypothetical protein